MKDGKITIHDISKALNIDSSTVSRALNNSPRVSQRTKVKILQKAKELGYQKNSLASNLRTQKTNTIGVIVPRISRNFFSSVISGIEKYAYELGYNVMICQSYDSFEREQRILNTLLSNRVDGILISVAMKTTSYEHLKSYLNHGSPIVFYDRPLDFENCSSISINDYKACFNATEHLILNGCRDIAFFSGSQLVELYRNRKRGYMDALKKHQLSYRESYCFESMLSEEDGIESTKKALQLERVDAIFSCNDTAAISAMKYLKKQGIKIPEEIAVVGFNNDPISAVIEPPLTTINQPDFEMGKIASQLLIEQIENKNSQKHSQVLDIELIVRGSSKKKL